jgi:hypothetical protein
VALQHVVYRINIFFGIIGSGSYGPRIDVGKGETLPAHKTKLKGLYRTGDYSFPGIGVPATAAAGAIVANSIVSVSDHLKMLSKIRLPVK